MMVKKRFAQFSLTAFVILIAACSSPEKSTASSAALVVASPTPVSAPAEIQASVSTSPTMNGSVVVVSVQLPTELENQPISGDFEGIPLPFFKSANGFQSVLGVPYDHKPGMATVKISVGEGKDAHSAEAHFTVVKGDYPSESIHVDKSKVQPKNPKHLKRIIKEQAEIKKIYDNVILKKYWEGPFLLPIQSSVTSRFGTKRLYNGVQNSFHPGLDLKAPEGTPIHADAAGKVMMAMDLFFTGNTVILDHGYGVITLYAHMSKLQVQKGQEVKAGELLGLSGKTGRVTGPHLHWQAVIHKQKVNPMDLTTQVMK